MALITCPECKKEVSDQALSCPHCGYPLQQGGENDTQPVSEPSPVIVQPIETQDSGVISVPSATEQKKNAKIPYIVLGVIMVVLVAIIIIKFSGNKMTASTVDTNGLYNRSLGVGVRLGTTKKDVDKLLGPPEQAYEQYIYPDGLYISYADGKVDSLTVQYPSNQWVTKKGITIESTTEDLEKLLGTPESIQDYHSEWWYYRKGTGDIGFRIVADKVNMVYIYDNTALPVATSSPSPTPKAEDASADEVDLDTLSAALQSAFDESFGYPGHETSWYKYVDTIRAIRDGDMYSISVILNSEDEEIASDIGNIVYGNYCINTFENIDFHATYVFDSKYKSLFSRND